MERSLLCEKISFSFWNHSTFIPKGYDVKIKPGKAQWQSIMYLDVFSSRYQITANIMKNLNIPGFVGEHVTCINSSNILRYLRQEHS